MAYVALVLWIVSAALMSAFEKKALEFVNWQTSSVIYDLIALATLPAFWWYYRADIRLTEISDAGLGWTLAAGICWLACCGLYFYLLKSFDASVLVSYGLIDVGLLCLLGWLFLGESLTLIKCIAIALMIAGAWLLGK